MTRDTMADTGDETSLDDGPAPLDDDEREEDVMTPDMGKGIMRNWLDRYQPAPVPGVTDSPGNRPAPRSGQLAAGHPANARHQALRPQPLAVVQTLSGDCTALASSIAEHQGRASLGLLDQAAFANASLGSQLGMRAPSGNPHGTGGPHSPGVTPVRPGGPAALPTPSARDATGYLAPARPVRRAPGE